MPNSERTGTSLERTLWAIGFAGVCWMLFNILSTFHIHGWKSFGLAIVLTALVVAVGRLGVRWIIAATELERRDPRARRGGNRAERRERARRHK